MVDARSEITTELLDIVTGAEAAASEGGGVGAESTGLQNAASVTSLMLTTEAIIAERPKDEKASAGGGHVTVTTSEPRAPVTER